MLDLPQQPVFQITCSSYAPYAKLIVMNNKTPAFTIIELLIVIVIIAILVAITAAGFNGITKSAKEASAKSDLKQAATQLEVDKAKSSNNQYPSTTSGLESSPSTILEITSTGTIYCLSAISAPNIAFHITNTNTSPQPGTCTDHLQPDAPTELANNTPHPRRK